MSTFTGDANVDPAMHNNTLEQDKDLSPQLDASNAVVPNESEKVHRSDEYVKFLGLSGVKLNLLIAICAGVGFVLFGYDQGVMGSLLTLEPFQKAFPQIDADHDDSKTALQGATIGIYEIGCFAGSVSAILWGNILGRRKMIWIGSLYVDMVNI